MRARYVDLEDCINSLIPTLSLYNSFTDFNFLDLDLQQKILNEFLDYCEVIFHLLFISVVFVDKQLFNCNIDAYLQSIDFIKFSLRSFNYNIMEYDRDKRLFEVVKINPEAEIIAALSEQTIKCAILQYLGARDDDIEEKETRLSILVDLLEPNLKKYSNDKNIGKIKEYVQLIRHPEVYKSKKVYTWFFDNKQKCLDELFLLCVYVQSFIVIKETINEYDALKKEFGEST